VAKPIQTYIFCLDDHRTFSEEVRKRFSDKARYVINISHNRDDLIRSIVSAKDHPFCKVVIVGLNETKESFLMAEKLVGEIKKTDIRTGIIILAPAEKIDEVRKTVRINIDSYIPRNANAILRIHNTVKKLISQHNLLIYRKRKTISMYALISFIIIAIVFVLAAWLKLPMYF
jgi:DNA-binding NarL/FixJ family response regulator